MSKRHPIDELFRNRLEHHQSDIPLGLWERIDQKRDWKHKLRNQARLRRPLPAVLLLSLTVAAFWLLPEASPDIGSFPVPKTAAWKVSPPENAPADVFVAEIPAEPSVLPVEKPVASANPPATIMPEIPARPTAPIAKVTSLVIDDDLQNETEFSRQALARPVIQSFSALPSRFSATDLKKMPAGFGIFNPDPKCARFGKGDWQLFADLTAAPQVAFRSFSTPNKEFESYTNSRIDTELPELSFSAGFRVSAVSGIGLAARTGLAFTQINETFDYTNENEERITIINIFGPDGEVIGTDTTIVSGVRHKVTSNTYQMLSVPVLLGYELAFNKLSASINAGALINIFFHPEGDFLSPQDLQPISFTRDDPGAYPAFRNKLGVGWYGSLALQYEIKSGLQLMLEPHLQYYPQSFTKDDFVNEQRYFLAGLSVGLRKNL